MTKETPRMEQVDYVEPTKQRLERGVWAGVPTDIPGVVAKQDLIECVVQRYHHRMLITDRQLDAGLRFRQVWRAAVTEPATTGPYGEARGGGGGPMATSEARFRLRKVLVDSGLARGRHDAPPLVLSCRGGEVAFPETAGLLLSSAGHVAVAVCGMDEWAGGTRRLGALRAALTILANYWGFPK